MKLTQNEQTLLNEICSLMPDDINDNLCFYRTVNASEKGILGSLKKKGLIYDSYEYMRDSTQDISGNWFPTEEGLKNRSLW